MIYRILYITLGLAIVSLGIDMSVKAGLGVSPWTVLHLGIARHTSLTQGQVSQLVGFAIIGLSFFLGIRPALGTVMNMLLIGWFYDLSVFLKLIPPATGLGLSLLYILVSVGITGFGAAMYMSAGLGAGPRDSLMLALTKRMSWSVGHIRTSMEVGVLCVGWVLGGPVGIATLIFSLSVGPTVERSFEALRQLSVRSLFADQVLVIPVTRRKVHHSPTSTKA